MPNLARKLSRLNKILGYWPNSLDCTDLNQCGARRDAELCRLCYKQNFGLPQYWLHTDLSKESYAENLANNASELSFLEPI